MAHEIDDAPLDRETRFENGEPVKPLGCEGEGCKRKTSHPSGYCSQCREDSE